jgi:gamma-glutamyltranspeptidase/glutathione hydrolase
MKALTRRTALARCTTPALGAALAIGLGLFPVDARAVGTPGAPATPRAGIAAVAVPDRPSAEVARDVLRRGGNAVDAAIATAFALAVTYPEAGNLGGGGFLTLHIDGEQAFLDFRETAPAAATRDMYLDPAGEPIPDASLVGARAAGVPGTVAGLWAAHQRYGSLPWRSLLAPAIRLAREGFVVDAQLAERVRDQSAELAGRTNFAAHFGGVVAGQRWRQPGLARTLERIAAHGTDGFYRGRTADLIVAEMRRGGGLVSAADLAGYRAAWREPLRFMWRGQTVVTAPPPSSGGVALAQLLGMREALAPAFAGLGHNSTGYLHLLAEMMKRVFADRAEHLGDPDFVSVPTAALIDPAYIARRAAEVRVLPSALATVRPGLEDSPQTTHLSVIDGTGGAVALTYTLNGGFGNGVVVTGAGFLLNNEMDDFSTRPGQPNLYGVVGGRANEIAPGKRMLSSMTPTLLLRDGRVVASLGTPGGSTIFTGVFQTLLNMADFGMDPQAAVAASRMHHQLLPPDRIVYSRCCALAPETLTGLRALGYKVEPSSWEFGDMMVIAVDAAGQLQTGADPRGRGVGLVFDAMPAPRAAPRTATPRTATPRAAAAR